MPGVLVVPDPDQRLVQQADDGGQDLAAAQVRSAEVPLDPLADRGKDLAELEDPAELRAVAGLAVRRMVAVLLPAPGITGRGLDVPGGIGTDPDVGPGRRNGQAEDAPSLGRIGDPGTVGSVEGPAPAHPAAADAGEAVRDVSQSGAARGFAVLVPPVCRLAHGARAEAAQVRTGPMPTTSTTASRSNHS